MKESVSQKLKMKLLEKAKKAHAKKGLPVDNHLEKSQKPDEVKDGGSDSDSPENDFKSFASMTESVLSGKKQKKQKSGGFQSMGLSYPVLRGILKKGYKVPTPIQRKAIPVIMEGKDVVAMARTGSGKTGAFLIPMLEKLKARTSKVGARALIFSPTRELAMQTLKFTKELGRFTGLKTLLVLGGEKMEDQFAAIHENPDIIVATPGRFLHLVIEMDLKLTSVEYVVFDEADRLFEMGFQEQLQEVLYRLPEHRQMLMFSATLPRVLVEFVRAGLSEPVLIRLDVEMKLSENLKTIYLNCRPHDKTAILLYLLKNVINLSEELTVVFLATKHHIEYIRDVLEKASIPCSYTYSSLDPAARKIHIAKFKNRQVGVLLVTDIAARGIDIPLLDNVINYNFPSKPKLFVHRVGRVARAGRTGTAYSLIAPDELPYLIDLHLFLGRPLTFADDSSSGKDGVCGSVPQSVIDDEMDILKNYHEASIDLQNMTKVCDNAYKKYVKSRPAPSYESVKRVKQLPSLADKIHPLFCEKSNAEVERSKFLVGMRKYRPNTTIFEIGATGKSSAGAVMREKRLHHSVIDKIRSMDSLKNENENHSKQESVRPSSEMAAASESEIQAVFKPLIRQGKKYNKSKTSPKKKTDFKDTEHFLPYMSKEHYSEMGLSVQSSFEQDASRAVLDLTGDDDELNKKLKNTWKWDRKRKRFTKDDGSEMQKKMKTESGAWIPKSYKSNLYEKWQSKNKISFRQRQEDDEDDNEDANDDSKGKKNRFRKPNVSGTGKFNKKFKNKKGGPQKRELKSKEEILKSRRRKATLAFHQKRRHLEKTKRARKQ